MTVTIWVVWFLLQIGSDFSDRIWFVTPDIIWSGSPDANMAFQNRIYDIHDVDAILRENDLPPFLS